MRPFRRPWVGAAARHREHPSPTCRQLTPQEDCNAPFQCGWPKIASRRSLPALFLTL